MMRYLGILILSIGLSGCSALGTIGSLLPGDDGSDINTNAQVGAQNTQAVVSTERKVEAKDNAVVETVEATKSYKVTGTQIINEEIPPYVWLLMILGWLLPSPVEIYNGILRLLRGKA